MSPSGVFPVVLFYGFACALGSIPFGVLMAKIFRVKNLTERGSGNIGATNVARVVGLWPAGVLTFFLDIMKGALPVLILRVPFLRTLLWPEAISDVPGNGSGDIFLFSDFSIWTAGLMAVIGHCFSPWVHLKGGKGVATGFGVMLILSPIAAVFGLLGYIAMFLTNRISSLASLAGLLLASVIHLALCSTGDYLWVSGALVFLILMRHETNIDALLQNRENTFR